MSAFQRLLARLWNDDEGFILSAELVLIATILVLALIVGLTDVRNSLSAELSDIASAFGRVNQSGSHGHGGGDHGGPFIYTSGHHE